MRWRFGPERGFDFTDAGAPVRVMGVLNITPDSFSDGGHFLDPDAALAQAGRMLDAGADLLDVGGESSRPGADPVNAVEERRRVVPVIEALRTRFDVPISIDTTKAEVARAALDAGAEIVNDISAGTFEPAILELAAARRAGLVLMHMRGTPATMQTGDLSSRDIVGDVVEHLAERAAAAERAGVERARICLDPGIGFGKTVEQNAALVAGLGRLVELGYPVLLGVSRKSFLGRITGRPVDERLAATTAAHACGVLAGAHLLRVHDVAEAVDAAKIAVALRRAGEGAS